MSSCLFAIVIIRVSSPTSSFTPSHMQAHPHWALSAASGPQAGLQGGWAAMRWDRELLSSVWPASQRSLLGPSQEPASKPLVFCIWLNYPLQMSAWMLPSVPWQFSSSNCMIAPLKCILSWFGSSVSLCLYPLFPFILNYILLTPLLEKEVCFPL